MLNPISRILFRPHSLQPTAGPSRLALQQFSSTSVMEKLKTHSGTKKRFRLTGGGLFKRSQAGKQHLNTSFSASRINRLGKTVYATKTQGKILSKLLPYA